MIVKLNEDGTVDITHASTKDLQNLAKFEFSYHLEQVLKVLGEKKEPTLPEDEVPF